MPMSDQQAERERQEKSEQIEGIPLMGQKCPLPISQKLKLPTKPEGHAFNQLIAFDLPHTRREIMRGLWAEIECAIESKFCTVWTACKRDSDEDVRTSMRGHQVHKVH